MLSINPARLVARLQELGEIGRDDQGRLARLAGTDADKAGRDWFVSLLREAELEVAIDRIGNIFGIWSTPENRDAPPVMIGSHIDSVVNAGIYDGCYGVLAGLEVVEALKAAGTRTRRPLVVAAFTNEEGARFSPDMMGSLVYAGGLALDEALAATSADGALLGEELARIGYAGEAEPGFLRPAYYLELHIEQGPVLEREGDAIGTVENLQGISWQRVTIEGTSNHAGTTPMSMRRDAGHAAARIMTFVRDRALQAGGSVATVGSLRLEPNVINVIPSRAVLTVDLRDPDEQKLRAAEADLARFLDQLAADEGVAVHTEPLVRTEPVAFDEQLCRMIDTAAGRRQLKARRMTSGAGHDAQMIARICPAAMIFVPSRGGISHNPREHTDPDQLEAGVNLLLDVAAELAVG